MLPALRRCRPGPVPLPALAAALGPGPFPGLCPAWAPRAVPARGRKSRHDPPAKSKAGRVKLPPPVDPEELLVVLERYRQHRLVLSALRYR
ncbi:28S ribosomal protein S26, mitochondrial-like, partial [Pyrgilauda ruficollis]|uniref:28S ribosomal protein S26, mitochondrial-like n=1 Tax=Pyrgilauda ruficollis TaxID=221976 RepID=UPI001B864AAD